MYAIRSYYACPEGRLILNRRQASRDAQSRRPVMGINTERDIEANLQIGPTDKGMSYNFV